MSHQKTPSSRQSVPSIAARKGAEKIVVLTAYTARMAELLDPFCDILMVGDSLGMVIYGFDSTLPVTLDLMIAHGRAVAKTAKSAMVVVDMPFGSYQESPAQAFASAARILKETGAQAVKLEGGAELADTVRHLTSRGIPVMGHVGLMPQHVHRYGGFKAQGKEDAARRAILADARAIADAGAFSIVLEGVVEKLAAEITKALSIPTIGIGASPVCDGQVLVVDDMLGMFETSPRFVKHYANLAGIICEAASSYAREVKAGRFPEAKHCYGAGETNPKLVKKG
jgi:3-methyl-2-oxobutanoate hydroxymethyltransferase